MEEKEDISSYGLSIPVGNEDIGFVYCKFCRVRTVFCADADERKQVMKCLNKDSGCTLVISPCQEDSRCNYHRSACAQKTVRNLQGSHFKSQCFERRWVYVVKCLV